MKKQHRRQLLSFDSRLSTHDVDDEEEINSFASTSHMLSLFVLSLCVCSDSLAVSIWRGENYYEYYWLCMCTGSAALTTTFDMNATKWTDIIWSKTDVRLWITMMSCCVIFDDLCPYPNWWRKSTNAPRLYVHICIHGQHFEKRTNICTKSIQFPQSMILNFICGHLDSLAQFI